MLKLRTCIFVVVGKYPQKISNILENINRGSFFLNLETGLYFIYSFRPELYSVLK